MCPFANKQGGVRSLFSLSELPRGARPNLSLNTDVPHAGYARQRVPGYLDTIGTICHILGQARKPQARCWRIFDRFEISFGTPPALSVRFANLRKGKAMPSISSYRALLALLVLFGSASVAHAQRAFVSAKTGLDSNPCTLVSPCRSFSTALGVVSAGGEIVALDSGGYGPVTIGKSITIESPPGIYAGITAPSGDALQGISFPS